VPWNSTNVSPSSQHDPGVRRGCTPLVAQATYCEGVTSSGKRLLIAVLAVSVLWEALALWWALGTGYRYAPWLPVRYAAWVPILSPFVAISALVLILILDASVRAARDVFGRRPSRLGTPS
jgi:hypothetical protein